MGLSIIPRADWGAKMNVKALRPLPKPIKYVLCAFTRRRFTGKTPDKRSARPGAPTIEIVEALQNLQAFDMRRLPDIRFNFLISPDGNVYKGRGWLFAPMVPHRYTKWKGNMLYIGYLGNYLDVPPSNDILKAKNEIIKMGIGHNDISPKFTELHMKHRFLKPIFEEVILSEENWRMKEPEWQAPMREEILYVFYTTTEDRYCMRNHSCYKMLRRLQAIHRGEDKYPDIQYNFLIGGDAMIYEGRGWKVRPSLPRKYLELQGNSLLVAFIGHFYDRSPTPKMFKARSDLIKYGVKYKYIKPKFLNFHM